MAKYIIALLVVVCFLLGFMCGIHYMKSKVNTNVASSAILDRIKDVLKVATVEANVNEIYQHKDFTWLDISPLRKTAMIRLQAKVLAGIDLDTSAIDINESNKTITITYNPTPKIISVDHHLDYYDLQQGSFNTFSSQELTAMESNAKTTVIQKVEAMGLLNQASRRRDEIFSSLQQICSQLGWKLVMSPRINLPSFKEVKK